MTERLEIGDERMRWSGLIYYYIVALKQQLSGAKSPPQKQKYFTIIFCAAIFFGV
jgi:hypothetical protein